MLAWLRACLAIIPSGKGGGSHGAHISESNPFLWAYSRDSWLWGALLSFTGLLGWGKQGLVHSICYSNFRVVLNSLAETGMGFCPTSDATGYDGFALSCCFLSGSNPFVP